MRGNDPLGVGFLGAGLPHTRNLEEACGPPLEGLAPLRVPGSFIYASGTYGSGTYGSGTYGSGTYGSGTYESGAYASVRRNGLTQRPNTDPRRKNLPR